MNRVYWYYRFLADVAWYNSFIANIEDALKNTNIAITGNPGVVTGFEVTERGLGQNFSVDVASGWGIDVYGQRVYNSATTNVPFTTDAEDATIEVTTVGHTRIVSVYAKYHVTDGTPVVDGNGGTVNTVGTEDTEFVLYQGASSAGTPTAHANPNDGSILLADVTISYGDSTIATADCDNSVADTFTVEQGTDAVKDYNIDWGTGTDQVSAADMPIADVGTYYTGTDVEAALQEAYAALLAHIADTSTHGITSAIAGLDEVQTFTNKTLTTPTIASFVNSTHSHQNASGGGTLDAAAIAAGTLPVARGGTGSTTSTGSGSVVLATSPTIATPTIASFTNSNHNHQNSAGGGTLDVAAIASGTLPVARGGTGTTTSTGSGSVVLSAAPALTGGVTLDSTTLVIDSTNHRVIMGAAASTLSCRLEVYMTGTAATAVVSSDASSTAATSYWYKDSASPANGDGIWNHQFSANNSTPTRINYATITAFADTVTAGSEDGRLRFNVYKAGTGTTQLTLDANGVTLPDNDPPGSNCATQGSQVKAWCYLDGTGGSNGDYNVSSTSKLATGQQRVNYDVDCDSSGVNIPVACVNDAGPSDKVCQTFSLIGATSGGCNVYTYDISSAAAVDYGAFVIVGGTQA